MTLPDFVEEGMGLFWADVLYWCRALVALVRVNLGYFSRFEALLSLLGVFRPLVCLKVVAG